MKKVIILTVIISTFFLAGCTTNNKTAVQEPHQVEDSQPINAPQENGETREITGKTGDRFLIPEVGIEIVFPREYTISKSTETNRRGSFVSYDFGYKSPLPAFQEIQFFSEASVKQFTDNCDVDSPCFFGDYPDLERYNNQKTAFDTSTDYGKYEFTKFGDRDYFVSNFKCTGDSCVIREYTTFIDDTKIDIWIIMADDTQVDAADSLFKEFEIIE